MGRYKPSEFLKYITGDPVNSVTGLSTYVLTNWTNVSGSTFWAMCNYFGLPQTLDGLRWVFENVLLPLNYRVILFHQFLTINWSNQHNPTEPSKTTYDAFDEYDMPVAHRFLKGTWGRDEHYEDEYVSLETPIDSRITTVDGGKSPTWSDPRFPSPFPINTTGRNFCQHGFAIEMPMGHGVPEAQQTIFERHYYPIMIEGYPSPASDVHPYYLTKIKRDYVYLASTYGLAARRGFLGAWTSVDVPDAPDYHLSVNYSFYNMEYYTKSSHFANETVGGIHVKDGSRCLLYEAFVSKTRPFTGETTTDIPPLYNDIVNYHYNMGWNPTWGWSRWIQEKIAEMMGDFAEWFKTVSPYAPRRFHWYNEFILDDVIRSNPKTDAITFQHQSGFVGSLNLPPSVDDENWVEIDCEEKLQWTLNRGGYGVIIHSTLGAPGGTGGPLCSGAANNTGWIQPDEIKREYLVTIPILASGLMGMDYQPCRICDFAWQRWSRYFGGILAKMRYYGGWFGQEKEATKVLLFGKTADAKIFPQFFTHSLDITWGLLETKFTADPDLTIYGGLTDFNVIASFAGGLNNVSTSLQQRIRNFVNNGGGLATTSIPSWASDMFATAVTISITHPIFTPFTNIDEYGRTIRVGNYGRGTVVHIPTPSGKIGLPTDPFASYIGGTPRDSFITLFTNAVMYAANPSRTDFPTILIGTDTIFRRVAPNFADKTRFSVCGKSGNLLVWISTDDNVASVVNLNLNTDFYGLPSNVVLVNVNTWEMSRVTAVTVEGKSFIPMRVTVKPAQEDVGGLNQRGGWAPIYVCPLPSDKYDIYCNAFVISRSVGVNANFTVKAAYMHPVFLVTNSSAKPNLVSANGIILPEMDKSTLNDPDTLEGFSYDATNSLLLIKFPSQGSLTPNAVSVVYGAVTTHSLEVDSAPPEGLRTYVNGVYVGDTPVIITITEGRHTPEIPLEVEV